MRKSIFAIGVSVLLGCSGAPQKENNVQKEQEELKEQKEKIMKTPKVTGVGGIFFKCDDPEKMRNWYGENLGLAINEYGSLFESRNTDNPDEKTYLQWSPFGKTTKYFEPSVKEFMVNFRVQNIEGIVKELKVSGITVVDEIEEFEYGKFVHIMDPEGNKIELWEPVDSEFTKSFEGETTH